MTPEGKPAVGTEESGLSGTRRWASAITIMLGVSLTVLANATTSMALPLISKDLGTSASSSVWVINAYLFATAISLLPMAALGDRYGHRLVFLNGLALFAAACLGCVGAEHSPWPFATLLAARLVQGIGAAGIMAVNLALLRATHPAERLGRWIGLNGMVVAATNAAGPSLAGVIISVSSWKWLFACLMVPGVAALIVGSNSLPESQRGRGRFDSIGATLQAIAIGSLVLALSSPASPSTVTALVVASLTLLAFVRREGREGHPLLPLDLLRKPLFAASFAAAWASFVAQMLALVVLPFLLSSRLGLNTAAIGFAMTPWPVAVMVTAPIAGALSDRVPSSILGACGLSTAAAGLMALALLPEGAQALSVAWRMGLTGVGFAIFTGPNLRALMSATPVSRSGALGGMHAVSRQGGQLVGSAVAGMWLAGPSLNAGAGRALVMAAIVALMGGLVCLFKPKLSGTVHQKQ